MARGVKRPARVVITGVGPISSIGAGREAFWHSIRTGRTGTRRIEFGWTRRHEIRSQVAAPVTPVDPAAYDIDERELALLDPAGVYALAASRLALEDAGLALERTGERRLRFRVRDADDERFGVVLGTGIGGLSSIEWSHHCWTDGAPFTGALRFALPRLIPNAVPAQVAIKYGLHGECKVVATACAAGTMAIGDAYRLVRDGELDLVLAGGVEKLLSDLDHGGYGVIGFDLLKTLSTRSDEPARASRPFDRDRDGFVLGEGAGVLVVERLEHARARGARIYAEITGYASTCDAHSMVQLEPSGDQMVRVMRRAMEVAGVAPGEVGYVNAHGTSTRWNDLQESRALRRVFGSRTDDVLVNSTKAMTGHGIAASGALEAITTALSLANGEVHACVNLDNPDPECDLALPRTNVPIRETAALSNSFGFGGHNASLVLRTA